MIFVTGGTGLLGNCVIRELVARGQQVRALCRRGTSHKPFENLDIEVVEGDLENAAALTQFVSGCKAVVHSAAFIHIGWSRLEESRRVNVEGTRRIVEACISNQAKLVHVSTVDTFPAAHSIDSPIDETSPSGVQKIPCNYVISKREADEVVREAIDQRMLHAAIIHPGFMLGPFDWKPSSGRLMLGVAKAPLALAPSGGCSLCDPRDVATAIVNAIELGKDGQSYIVAGENVKYTELWRRILAVSGRPKKVLAPRRILQLAGSIADGLSRVLPAGEGDINSAAIGMGQLNHYYSSGKAERELHYSRRSSEETLRDAWDWLKLHHW